MNRFLTRDEFHESIRLAFVAAGICPRTGLRNFNNGPVWKNLKGLVVFCGPGGYLTRPLRKGETAPKYDKRIEA